MELDKQTTPTVGKGAVPFGSVNWYDFPGSDLAINIKGIKKEVTSDAAITLLESTHGKQSETHRARTGRWIS